MYALMRDNKTRGSDEMSSGVLSTQHDWVGLQEVYADFQGGDLLHRSSFMYDAIAWLSSRK